MSAVVKPLRSASAFRIEKNIPMPRKAHPCQYPFMDMLVGDSFLVPADDVKRTINLVGKSARTFTLTNPGGYKFACRTVQDGVRCWRIK